jgi:hypothetical protein
MRQFRAPIEGQQVGRKDLALVDMAGVEASRAVDLAAVQPGAAIPGMMMRERRDAEAEARGGRARSGSRSGAAARPRARFAPVSNSDSEDFHAPAGAIGSGHGHAVPGPQPARAAQVPRRGNHLLQPVLAGGPAQTMSSFVAESVTSG